MAKRRTVARCTDCGHEEPRWVGRCPGCLAWGTVVEAEPRPERSVAPATAACAARPIAQVPLHDVDRIVTGIGELDRVLGGGLVPGVAVLIGGEPGVGKSTLLLHAADAVARRGGTVLYASGEESAGQLRLRAQRLGALSDRLLVAAETSLPAVAALVDEHRPQLLVVDSIQTVADPGIGSSPGSVVQVRECAASLVRLAKTTGTATVVVGHVTKEGTIAGPRVLEHLVDVVVSFEGDDLRALRLLRAAKNRFGAVGEIGCFEMSGDGLREVADPSRLFVGEHAADTAGVVRTVTIEGPRPLAVEVQALVVSSTLAAPRRQASGLDPARLPLLTAVLERRASVDLRQQDVFASAVGGVRVREPAADLALCLAIASSCRDVAVPADTVAVGEVGLAGEVRSVPQLPRRLAEAARLGATAAVVPAAYDGGDHGLRLHRAEDLRGAVAAALRAPAGV